MQQNQRNYSLNAFSIFESSSNHILPVTKAIIYRINLFIKAEKRNAVKYE